MNRDFTVQNVASIPNTMNVKRKPTYLLKLENTYEITKFVCMDVPDTNVNFIIVRGFFSELPEDEIIKTFPDMLTNVAKDLIVEMWFPTHKVVSIKSLTFSAKK